MSSPQYGTQFTEKAQSHSLPLETRVTLLLCARLRVEPWGYQGEGDRVLPLKVFSAGRGWGECGACRLVDGPEVLAT